MKNVLATLVGRPRPPRSKLLHALRYSSRRRRPCLLSFSPRRVQRASACSSRSRAVPPRSRTQPGHPQDAGSSNFEHVPERVFNVVELELGGDQEPVVFIDEGDIEPARLRIPVGKLQVREFLVEQHAQGCDFCFERVSDCCRKALLQEALVVGFRCYGLGRTSNCPGDELIPLAVLGHRSPASSRTDRARSHAASARLSGSARPAAWARDEYARHCARETATLRRLRESRNSRLRGTSAPLDVAIEKKTTGASWPWNLSTVPTRAPRGQRLGQARDLRVVRRDDEDVVEAEGRGSALRVCPLLPEQPLELLADALGLLGRRPAIALVLDR